MQRFVRIGFRYYIYRFTMHTLAAFISRYCDLPDNDLYRVMQRFTHTAVAKDTILLKKGQVCETLSVILSGAFRLFALDEEGKDTTTWLTFEGNIITEPSSFLSRQPSRYYIQALEHSEMAGIRYDSLEALYKEIPAFQVFGRKLMEDILVSSMCRATFLLLDTPQQRYERLLRQPAQLQRVPLKYLASYIGITPTSLSRLRARKLS